MRSSSYAIVAPLTLERSGTDAHEFGNVLLIFKSSISGDSLVVSIIKLILFLLLPQITLYWISFPTLECTCSNAMFR